MLLIPLTLAVWYRLRSLPDVSQLRYFIQFKCSVAAGTDALSFFPVVSFRWQNKLWHNYFQAVNCIILHSASSLVRCLVGVFWGRQDTRGAAVVTLALQLWLPRYKWRKYLTLDLTKAQTNGLPEKELQVNAFEIDNDSVILTFFLTIYLKTTFWIKEK